MNRSILLMALGVLVLVALLGVLDVIPLGFGGGSTGGDGDSSADLLGAEGEEGTGATLKGRGTKKDASGSEGSGDPEIDPSLLIPTEVRGGTKNGAVVRGRVVRAEGGIPLADVFVTLSRPDSIISYLRAEANGRFDELLARTGSDGRFAFLDVTPSKGYVVRTSHLQFAVASSDELDLRGRQTVDVGDLELGMGATITGRVVDSDQKPVPNVRVVVTWRISNPLNVILSDPDTAPEIERETTTDAEGRFILDRLEPAPKTILVMAPIGAAQIVRSVSLEAGEVKEIDDIVLPGNGVLAGTVVWADGSPVVGVRVFAAPRMQAAVRSMETDAEGKFRLTWLPEGRNYVVGVMVPGLPVSLTMNLALGREDLRIEIPLPGVLEGVVVAEKSKSPVPRFTVQLDSSEEEKDWMLKFLMEQVKRGLGPTPFVDERGAFRFPRVAAGTYSVTVAAPGFPAISKAPVVVAAGETTTLQVEIPDGNVGRGRVERAGGSNCARARLYVIHGGVKQGSKGVQLHGYITDREPDAVTGATGAFVLPPQTPGRYDVIAAHDDALPAVLRGVDLRGGDADDLLIRLPPSGAVKGVLRDEDGNPAKGEKIYILFRSGIVRTEEADMEGKFHVGGLPVGRCLVRWFSLQDARHYRRFLRSDNDAERDKAYDELRHAGDEHELVDGRVTELTVRLPHRTRVRGRLTVGGESPSTRMRVFWITVEGTPRWIEVEFDQEGAYETRLEPGKYTVYLPSSRAMWVAREIDIPDQSTFTLNLDEP